MLWFYLLLAGYVLVGGVHRVVAPARYVRAEQAHRAEAAQVRGTTGEAAPGPAEAAVLARRVRLLGVVRLVILAVILWAIGVSVTWHRPITVSIHEGQQAPERKLIEAEALKFLKAGKASGLTVAAVSGTNRLLLTFGRAGLSRGSVDGDTMFEIGSITKVFTGIALAREIEAGALSIGQPVRELLPARAALPKGGEEITLGDLTSHASGLPRIPPNMSVLGGLKMAFLGGDPYANYSEADFFQGLRSAKLLFKPGERSEYSNFGTGLLGWLLAKRAGVSYEDYIRRQVCEPLGMEATRIDLPGAASDRVAQGYRWMRRLGPIVISLRSAPWMLRDVFAGAGGLRSNGKDMLRFLDANMHPEDSPIGAALRSAHEPLVKEGKDRWIGMNWISLKYPWSEQWVVWHNGGTGGYRSYLGFTVDGAIGVLVLSNSAESVDGVGTRLLRKLLENAAANNSRATNAPPDSATSPPDSPPESAAASRRGQMGPRSRNA